LLRLVLLRCCLPMEFGRRRRKSSCLYISPPLLCTVGIDWGLAWTSYVSFSTHEMKWFVECTVLTSYGRNKDLSHSDATYKFSACRFSDIFLLHNEASTIFKVILLAQIRRLVRQIVHMINAEENLHLACM
jgi:hypothetical protein